MTLRGMRIVVTGAAGRVGFPIARDLAAAGLGNTVFGVARFCRPGGVDDLRAAGIEPVRRDFADGSDFGDLPDADYVFHAAAALGPAATKDWRYAFEVNAQAAGRLVERYAACKGSSYCSTGSAYEYQGARPLREDDPPGAHIGNYSLSKIAGEAVVEFASRRFGTPVTIIRIFSTYGPMGGAPADRLELILRDEPIPMHPDTPNRYNPIYEDDYVRLGVRAMEVAACPPIVVNWSGSRDGEPRGVLHVPGRARRPTRRSFVVERPRVLAPLARHHLHARDPGAHHDPVEGRIPAHGRRPSSRARAVAVTFPVVKPPARRRRSWS